MNLNELVNNCFIFENKKEKLLTYWIDNKMPTDPNNWYFYIRGTRGAGANFRIDNDNNNFIAGIDKKCISQNNKILLKERASNNTKIIDSVLSLENKFKKILTQISGHQLHITCLKSDVYEANKFVELFGYDFIIQLFTVDSFDGNFYTNKMYYKTYYPRN